MPFLGLRPSVMGVNECECVWIGGLKERLKPDAEFIDALRKFINKKVEGLKYVSVGVDGHGAAVFSSEEYASAAVKALHCKQFKGRTLKADIWVNRHAHA